MGSERLISQNVVWGSRANIPSAVLQIMQKCTAEEGSTPASSRLLVHLFKSGLVPSLLTEPEPACARLQGGQFSAVYMETLLGALKMPEAVHGLVLVGSHSGQKEQFGWICSLPAVTRS